MYSASSRMVTIGSEASRQSGGLDLEKGLLDTAPFTARGSSYRAWIVQDGTGVAVHCLCPGFNVTGLVEN